VSSRGLASRVSVSGRAWCCDVGSRLDLLDSDGLLVDPACFSRLVVAASKQF
jgi:hypothetical protein